MTDKPLIYRLLPALYRNRDAASDNSDAGSSDDGALLALTKVLEDVRLAVEQDIAGLYRNWFAETCDPWVLPYIGDLVGLSQFELDGHTMRAIVADTMAFRRRKGTLPATEKRLADLAGWPVKITDDHPKVPVEAQVWRQSVFAVALATPRPATGPGSRRGCYDFNPFGQDVPLFNTLRPYPGIEAPFIDALDAPAPLTRATPSLLLRRSIAVYVERTGDGPLQQVLSEAIAAGDLSEWRMPTPAAGASPLRVVIDPELGRLALVDPPARLPRVAVSYSYGASAGIGGGPYERAMTAPSDGMWRAYVHSDATAAPPKARDEPPAFPTLGAALAAFAAIPGPGLIRILDSASYDVAGVEIGDQPDGCATDPNAPRRLIIEALSGEIPFLTGPVIANATGPGLRLVLSGLWVEGEIDVRGDAAVEIRIHHCSIHPGAGDKHNGAALFRAAQANGPSLRVGLDASITGPIELAGDVTLTATDSVVDGGPQGDAIVGQAAASLTRATVLGYSALGRLEAVDVIFNGRVEVSDITQGEIRTSYVPPGSRTPRRVDCPAESTLPPEFVSLAYGQPGYARLTDGVSPAIAEGGSGGSEMGAYHALNTAARAELLKTALEAYFPVGLDWRIVWK